jgi:hypothetical protein
VNGSATHHFIDFVTVSSGGSVSAVYSPAHSQTSGTLEVMSGGTLVAEVTLMGHYAAPNFQITSGMNGSVEIIDPFMIAGGATLTLASTANGGASLAQLNGNVALLGNYIVSLFAPAEGGLAAPPTETQHSQATLVHPHTG